MSGGPARMSGDRASAGDGVDLEDKVEPAGDSELSVREVLDRAPALLWYCSAAAEVGGWVFFAVDAMCFVGVGLTGGVLGDGLRALQ